MRRDDVQACDGRPAPGTGHIIDGVVPLSDAIQFITHMNSWLTKSSNQGLWNDKSAHRISCLGNQGIPYGSSGLLLSSEKQVGIFWFVQTPSILETDESSAPSTPHPFLSSTPANYRGSMDSNFEKIVNGKWWKSRSILS